MKCEKLLIHDVSSEELLERIPDIDDYLIIDANKKAANCIGCFGCWLLTPGKCVLKDSLQDIGVVIAQVKEIVLISECCYGGYSPSVKRVLDRSISLCLPFFTYRSKQIHHPFRYEKRQRVTVYLYGDMDDFEKEIAGELLLANGINMGWKDARLVFLSDEQEVMVEWR